jgi:hypothetical protein
MQPFFLNNLQNQRSLSRQRTSPDFLWRGKPGEPASHWAKPQLMAGARPKGGKDAVHAAVRPSFNEAGAVRFTRRTSQRPGAVLKKTARLPVRAASAGFFFVRHIQ